MRRIRTCGSLLLASRKHNPQPPRETWETIWKHGEHTAMYKNVQNDMMWTQLLYIVMACYGIYGSSMGHHRIFVDNPAPASTLASAGPRAAKSSDASLVSRKSTPSPDHIKCHSMSQHWKMFGNWHSLALVTAESPPLLSLFLYIPLPRLHGNFWWPLTAPCTVRYPCSRTSDTNPKSKKCRALNTSEY